MEQEIMIRPVDMYLTVIDGTCRLAVLNTDGSRCKFISNDKIMDIKKKLHIEYAASPWQDYPDDYLFVTAKDNSGKDVKLSPLIVSPVQYKDMDELYMRDNDHYSGDQFVNYYACVDKEKMNLDSDKIHELYSLFRFVCGKDPESYGFKNDNRYKPMTLENALNFEGRINEILKKKTNHNENDIGFWESSSNEYLKF